MDTLRARLGADVERTRRSLGFNALGAMAVAIAEVSFAAASVMLTAAQRYEEAAVATLASGLAVTIDNALRLREASMELHDRLHGLRALREEIDRPPGAREGAEWEAYRALTTSSRLDYPTAILGLCAPPAEAA